MKQLEAISLSIYIQQNNFVKPPSSTAPLIDFEHAIKVIKCINVKNIYSIGYELYDRIFFVIYNTLRDLEDKGQPGVNNIEVAFYEFLKVKRVYTQGVDAGIDALGNRDLEVVFHKYLIDLLAVQWDNVKGLSYIDSLISEDQQHEIDIIFMALEKAYGEE